MKFHRRLSVVLSITAASANLACKSSPPIIAVIPRTSGTMLWEPMHRGAQGKAVELGVTLYWNAPTREDDVDGQIALVDRATSTFAKGLILAPDHSQALIVPVRRAVAHGVCTVIVSSPLSIAPSGELTYVLNDEKVGGRLAVDRVAAIVHGQGNIAILGVNENIAGIVSRTATFESALLSSYPHIQIVDKRSGTFNVAHEQRSAEEALKDHPDISVLVAMSGPAIRGAVSAIKECPRQRKIKIIGFDPDTLNLDYSALDSFILQDTEQMGRIALQRISGRLNRQPIPARTEISPILVTRENISDPHVRAMVSQDWEAKTFNVLSGQIP